jgi:hypothetical protein
MLTNLLQKLDPTPTPCNPWHKHPTYNNRNTPTHTQGPQNSAFPSLLISQNHPTSCLHF